MSSYSPAGASRLPADMTCWPAVHGEARTIVAWTSGSPARRGSAPDRSGARDRRRDGRLRRAARRRRPRRAAAGGPRRARRVDLRRRPRSRPARARRRAASHALPRASTPRLAPLDPRAARRGRSLDARARRARRRRRTHLDAASRSCPLGHPHLGHDRRGRSPWSSRLREPRARARLGDLGAARPLALPAAAVPRRRLRCCCAGDLRHDRRAPALRRGVRESLGRAGSRSPRWSRRCCRLRDAGPRARRPRSALPLGAGRSPPSCSTGPRPVAGRRRSTGVIARRASRAAGFAEPRSRRAARRVRVRLRRRLVRDAAAPRWRRRSPATVGRAGPRPRELTRPCGEARRGAARAPEDGRGGAARASRPGSRTPRRDGLSPTAR